MSLQLDDHVPKLLVIEECVHDHANVYIYRNRVNELPRPEINVI